MKKAVFIGVSVLCFFLVFACASPPKPEPRPEPTRPEPARTEPEPVPEPVVEPVIQQPPREEYRRNQFGIILDGAGKYTVVSGDTLSGIARRQYREGYDYPLIMMASGDVVSDQDKIDPGMELTIPDRQRNLNDDRAKAALKNYLREVAGINDRRGWHETAAGMRKRADTL